MKYWKRLIVFCQIFLLLTAYQENPAAAAQKLFYNYTNGLEYESKCIFNTPEDDNYIEVIGIHGLKDTSLQEYINNKIEEEALLLYYKDLPPYRGIKTIEAKTQKEERTQKIRCQVTFNQSNILSLILRKVIASSSYRLYVTEEVPLTFDLRTGSIIILPDLFDAETDFQTVISDYVRKGISDNGLFKSRYFRHRLYVQDDYRSSTLLKPFENIKETQKFFISSTGEINLLLDYDTPEFAVGMEPAYLVINADSLAEVGVSLAFIEKYETRNESIYIEDFPRRKVLIESGTPTDKSWGPYDEKNTAMFPNAHVLVATSVITQIENRTLAEKITQNGNEPFAYLNAVKDDLGIDEELYGYAYFYYGTSSVR